MDKQGCKIKWTKNSVEDYNRIILYLAENWSEIIAINFDKVVENKLKILSQNPLIGISSQKIENVRSILLTKHNRMYYRVKNNSIELLNILDTRQNPKKNPY